MSSLPENQTRLSEETQAKHILDTDLAMILQVTVLIDLIQKRPVERIAAYSEEFRVLSDRFESLSRRLGVQSKGSHDDSGIAEQQLVRTVEPALVGKTLRYRQAAIEALQCAIRSIPSVLKAITAISHAANTERHWLEQDLRIAHLHPIQRLRKHRDSQAVLAHDRLLLILSCHSLAQDFQCFENSNGWVPKEDQLVERISGGHNPSTQSIGKHLQNFLSSHSTLPADREKMDAGVRFGTKLRVLDAMTNASGIGPGLSLLLGFEYQKFSRLSYNAFAALKQSLEDNEEQRRAIQEISETVGSWFQNCLVHYHQLYSSTPANMSRPIQKALQVAPALSSRDFALPFQRQEGILLARAKVLPFSEAIPQNLPSQLTGAVENSFQQSTRDTLPIDILASANNLSE